MVLKVLWSQKRRSITLCWWYFNTTFASQFNWKRSFPWAFRSNSGVTFESNIDKSFKPRRCFFIVASWLACYRVGTINSMYVLLRFRLHFNETAIASFRSQSHCVAWPLQIAIAISVNTDNRPTVCGSELLMYVVCRCAQCICLLRVIHT